ncbi:MAG: hypothetical protein ABIK15_07130 [Pseudomonadota bacterium]
MKIELCCKRLQFMWDNDLLEERSDVHYARYPDGTESFQTFIKGYRVRRTFFLFRRDRVFYRCPFCNHELIFPIQVYIPQLDITLGSSEIKLGLTTEDVPYSIPMSKLKEALLLTKMRSRKWPPEK